MTKKKFMSVNSERYIDGFLATRRKYAQKNTCIMDVSFLRIELCNANLLLQPYCTTLMSQKINLIHFPANIIQPKY